VLNLDVSRMGPKPFGPLLAISSLMNILIQLKKISKLQFLILFAIMTGSHKLYAHGLRQECQALFSERALADQGTISPKQYLSVPSGVKMPVIYHPQNQDSGVTFVMVGGLDSNIETFKKTSEILEAKNEGTLRLELDGQGELIGHAGNLQPIPLKKQATDLISAIGQLKIRKDKIALVGYSYGAAVVVQAAFDLLMTQGVAVHSINLINPYTDNAEINSDFGSVFLLLKNLSAPVPGTYESLKDLLTYLGLTGGYLAQHGGGWSQASVMASYDLFAGVPQGEKDISYMLRRIKSRVNMFDGLADLVVPSSEKQKQLSEVPEALRGIYYTAEGVTHRAPEEAPDKVADFLEKGR